MSGINICRHRVMGPCSACQRDADLINQDRLQQAQFANQNGMLGRHQMAAGNEQAALAQQGRLQQAIGERVFADELGAAKKRIAELEALVAQREKEWREQFEFSITENQRACRLADEAGALLTEMQTVKAELCDALREIERLKRKAGAR